MCQSTRRKLRLERRRERERRRRRRQELPQRLQRPPLWRLQLLLLPPLLRR